jgi:hypothetical protein
MAMQGMREMLRGSLGRSLRALSETDRLAAAWPVACGAAMAEHGEVVGFADGMIEVAVSDGVWLRQMLSLQGQLQAELARIAQVKATGIHFQLKKR